MEPLEGGVSDADGGESAEEERMGYGVKCCTKVKEDEDGGYCGGGGNQTGKDHKGNFV